MGIDKGSRSRSKTALKALMIGTALFSADLREASAFCSPSYNFIQMPAGGYPNSIGWRSWSPDSERWGTPELVYGLMNAFYEWVPAIGQGGTGRFVVGDLSKQGGGNIGHASHRCGIDADVTYLRRFPEEGWPGATFFNSDPHYARESTAWFLTIISPRHLAWDTIFFDDPALRRDAPYPIKPAEDPNDHHDHWHGRIVRPASVQSCCNHSNCG